MNKRTFRAVILSVLTIGIWLGAALPALADHTEFSQREYQVGEDTAYVELTVGTSCCPLGSGQIDYYTSNASAIAGEDYQQTSGTLTFPAEYKIRVPIIDDDLLEGEEQFEVRLTNYRGTFINNMGRTNTAVVRILDDETPISSSSAVKSSSPPLSSGSIKQRAAQPPERRPTSSRAESSTSENVSLPQKAETPTAEGRPVAVRGHTEAETQRTFPAALAAAAYAFVAGAAFWMLWRRRLARSIRARLG